jgi:hypothetical protein
MSNHQELSPEPEAVEPERNTVRIYQTHNASGSPAQAQFVEVISNASLTTLASDTVKFLSPLNVTQTEHVGVFTYSDPARGSGWLRLERFRTPDIDRVQDLVRMEEITRVIGRQPLRPADSRYGRSMVLPTKNPWAMLVYSVFGFIAGIAVFGGGLAAASNFAELIAIVVMGFILILVSIALAVIAVIRVRWWERARAYVRQQGIPMPPDLTGI